ncbi:MAG TPA: hypothetical protein EYG51_22125 [Pseudomonadales bacterium]|nr:hypothetical protein [Pseudomonadales bacterium]
MKVGDLVKMKGAARRPGRSLGIVVSHEENGFLKGDGGTWWVMWSDGTLRGMWPRVLKHWDGTKYVDVPTDSVMECF